MGIRTADRRNNRSLGWLLALNLIGLSVLGGRHVYFAVRERQEEHRAAARGVDGLVRMGEFDSAEAMRLLELSRAVEHGGRISDEELDRWLDRLRSQEPSYRTAAGRRLNITAVLGEAVPTMTVPQKERLFRAVAAEMAQADPHEEIGLDVVGPVKVLTKIGDARALPLIRAHAGDPRPAVHRVVREALKTLGGRSAG